jgi:hypothetical protein
MFPEKNKCLQLMKNMLQLIEGWYVMDKILEKLYEDLIENYVKQNGVDINEIGNQRRSDDSCETDGISTEDK